MSKEAAGRMGGIIGSSIYWSRLNDSQILRLLMRDTASTAYYSMLSELAAKANAAIEEIYTDLHEKSRIIRYIPSGNRNALAKQVRGLYDICNMTRHSSGSADACISLLNMRGSSSSDSELDKAVSMIKSNRTFSTRDILDMLKDAAQWGISSAANGDEDKKEFLEALAQGNRDSFFQEILDAYEAQESSVDYSGRCGYDIGSNGYLYHMESIVFGSQLPSTYSAAWGGADYDRMLLEALENVAERLEGDLEDAARHNNYITDETAENLRSVIRELEHCGVRTGFLYSRIEKLAWYVGGDEREIRNLQSALNEIDGNSLLEDGVFGEKTKEAVGRTVDKILHNFSQYLTSIDNLKSLDYLAIQANILASSPKFSFLRQIPVAILNNRKLIQSYIWQLGSNHYLRGRGYNVSATFLEHALKEFPNDLYYSDGSEIVQKIKRSSYIQEKVEQLTEYAVQNPNENGFSGSFDDFGRIADQDLNLSIGNANLDYVCVRGSSELYISFKIKDTYNFDNIRSIYVNEANEIGFRTDIGSVANDLALLSQADGVLKSYDIIIDFQIAVPLEGSDMAS